MPLRKKGYTYPETKKRSILYKFIAIIALGVVVGLCVMYVLVKKPSVLNNLIATPTPIGTIDNALLLEEIGKIFELPIGEEPTIATVTDPTQLIDQPFFKKSQIGDIALVYANARKAILYRPSAKKVIEVGVVNNPTVTNSSPTVTPEPSLLPEDGSE